MNWTMGIKYKRDQDPETPVAEFTPNEADMDEFRCFKIFYKDIGLEPFEVQPGEPFWLFQQLVR